MTRDEIIRKMHDDTAASVVGVLDRLERRMGTAMFRQVFKSITVDNGSEFADCKGMERSCLLPGEKRTHVYYCHPGPPESAAATRSRTSLSGGFSPRARTSARYHKKRCAGSRTG